MYALPARPDGLTGENSAHLVRAGVVAGRPGYCCVCSRPCTTWWSAAPPQRYVPLHERAACVQELLHLWDQGHGGEDAERAPAYAAGAYARRAGVAVPVREWRSQRAAVLPEGFRPGPFWLPGDTATSPWTVAGDAATGRFLVPCGPSVEHAEKTLLQIKSLGSIGRPEIPVAGVAVFDPGGDVVGSWGDAVDPHRSRWSIVSRISEWRHCSGCDDLRWPGSWMTAQGTRLCLTCTRASEVGDPRPAIPEPARPSAVFDPRAKQKEKLEAERRKRIRRR